MCRFKLGHHPHAHGCPSWQSGKTDGCFSYRRFAAHSGSSPLPTRGIQAKPELRANVSHGCTMAANARSHARLWHHLSLSIASDDCATKAIPSGCAGLVEGRKAIGARINPVSPTSSNGTAAPLHGAIRGFSAEPLLGAIRGFSAEPLHLPISGIAAERQNSEGRRVKPRSDCPGASGPPPPDVQRERGHHQPTCRLAIGRMKRPCTLPRTTAVFHRSTYPSPSRRTCATQASDGQRALNFYARPPS